MFTKKQMELGFWCEFYLSNAVFYYLIRSNLASVQKNKRKKNDDVTDKKYDDVTDAVKK